MMLSHRPLPSLPRCKFQAVAIVAGLSLVSVGLAPVLAQDAKEPATGIPESSIAKNFSADPNGHRAALAQRGVTYGLNYTGDVFGVAQGGIRRGSTYIGLLEGIVDVDFEKLSGWKGLTFHSSAFQIHGRGISGTHVGLLNPISNIEATPATRLFELWFEQELIKDKLNLRFGQMRVDYDGEFINSQTAGLFLNANFGWPAILGVNMPSGGVTFPLAGMGVRLKYTPTDKLTFLAAVFNDDPAGPCDGDPQVCNNNGLKFRIKDNPFAIGEVQYKYSDGKQPGSLKGQFKFGAMVDFGTFQNTRFGTDGLSLANPASNGTPLRHKGNHGVYSVIDQQVYRPTHSGAGAGDGVFLFARVAGGLPAYRNVVDFAFDTGLRFTGMVPNRPADEFGVGLGYNSIAKGFRELDRDAAAFAGANLPVRRDEWVAEFTYKAKLAEGWFLQPNVQYIGRPGGGAADPNEPAKRIEDAVVLGVRSTVNY